jgi:hypothetical protein
VTDTSAILASLDRFIERLARHGEVMIGHRVATQYQPMGIAKPLINQGNNHSRHSGHPKQETFAETDHERCNSTPSPAEDSSAGLTRRVSSVGGYNGKSGKSPQNQSPTGSRRENANGHSGKSPSDQQVASDPKDTDDQGGTQLPTLADASRLDPTIWSDLYQERAAHRQFEGDYPRVEAELLAWREIEWRWHFAHREQVPAEVCAGCGQLIGADEALDLIDGARIHMKEHRCRIAYEQRWRRAASSALVTLGLQPPGPIGSRCAR